MWAQKAVWWLVRVFGPRVLPGRSKEWSAPFGAEVWSQLADRWRTAIGPFDEYAVHLRRPAERAGSALLLLQNGSPVGFVKLQRGEAEALMTERVALKALCEFKPRSFTVPSPITWGTVEGWHYLMISPLPVGIHTPAVKPPVAEILEEVGTGLEPSLPRPPGTPPHWEPMHGDFTPWNLRAIGRDKLVLLDWENATWAPPGADALWYDAVRRVTRLRVTSSGIDHSDEVIEFWIRRLSHQVQPAERTIASSALRLLEGPAF